MEVSAETGIRLVSIRTDGADADAGGLRELEAVMLASERQVEGRYLYGADLPPDLGARFVQVLAQTVSGEAASSTFDLRSPPSGGF